MSYLSLVADLPRCSKFSPFGTILLVSRANRNCRTAAAALGAGLNRQPKEGRGGGRQTVVVKHVYQQVHVSEVARPLLQARSEAGRGLGRRGRPQNEQ